MKLVVSCARVLGYTCQSFLIQILIPLMDQFNQSKKPKTLNIASYILCFFNYFYQVFRPEGEKKHGDKVGFTVVKRKKMIKHREKMEIFLCFSSLINTVWAHCGTRLRICQFPGHFFLFFRFCKDVFDKNYKATIGVDFEMERFEVLGVPFSLQL